MAEKALDIKDKLSGIVGSENISSDSKLLEDYREAGLTSGGKPAVIVRPSGVEQVKALVELARTAGINLVPSSSGPPHMLGDSVPSGEGVIVDMSGMDRIVRMDRRNKVAIIEPGVTFAALREKAERVGLKVLTPLMPRASKSVLASYLEREPITIPKYHWDMTDPLLCIEVIFGTGDMFRTGEAAGPGTLEEQWESGGAQKNPLGPAHTDFAKLVQGAQGTMGIVTWASVKLELLPGVRRLYFIQAEDLESLRGFVYRALKQRLGDEFLLLNSINLASVIGKNSEEAASLVGEIASPWTLVYCVAGYEYFPEDRAAFQENDIAAIAREFGLEIKKELQAVSTRRMMHLLDNPSEGVFWKLRRRGGCREIFFLTTFDKVPGFIDVMRKSIEGSGSPRQEVGVYIQPIQQGRLCHLEFDLPYNPDDPDETGKVNELVLKAGSDLQRAGAYFSRPYGPWADMVYTKCPDTVMTLRKVKGMLDPDHVLNRGKLCFSEEVG